MSRLSKGLTVIWILLFLLAMVGSISIAQVGFGFPSDFNISSPNLYIPPVSNLQNLKYILVEDFEYSDSPLNHGWSRSETSGIWEWDLELGYIFDPVTMTDSQLESRVLDIRKFSPPIPVPEDNKIILFHDIKYSETPSDPINDLIELRRAKAI